MTKQTGLADGPKVILWTSLHAHMRMSGMIYQGFEGQNVQLIMHALQIAKQRSHHAALNQRLPCQHVHTCIAGLHAACCRRGDLSGCLRSAAPAQICSMTACRWAVAFQTAPLQPHAGSGKALPEQTSAILQQP